MTVQTASLTMAEASTPVSGLTVVKGADKVDGIGLVFTAGDASDINIRQFAARIYVNTASTFLAASEDASPNGEVTTAYLYDGDTLLSSKTTSATAAAHDYGAVTFDGLDIDITAGSTKKLVIKYDVSDSLAATRYVAVGALASTVTAYDNEGNAVTVSSSDVNNYVLASEPDHYKILSTSGSLTMAQDSSTPDSAIVIAGTEDNVVSKVKFTATNENWTINKLRVIIDSDNDGVGDTTNESSISTINIAYGNTTKSGSLSGGYANFTDLGWVIEQDTEEILTISTNLSAINAAVNTTGRQIRLGVDEDDGFEAVGESSVTDTDLELGDVNAWGNVMYLRKSKPTVALATVGTTLTNGPTSMHSFTVAADAAGDIAVKKFSWDVLMSDYGSGNVLTATTWKLYKGNSVKTAISASFSDGSSTSTAATTGAAISVTASGTLVAEMATEEIIAAGTSQTFTLKATISNAVVNDSISTTLINDNNDLTAYVAGYVTNNDLELVQLHDGSTAASVDFLWSDKARGINHSSTYDQTTKKDWTDGYLIEIDVLPTNTVSLVFPS